MCPALGGVMNTVAFHQRLLRPLAALSGGFGLVLVLGAAASSSPGALAGTQAAAGARAASGGVWGKAEEVPGLAALNKDGNAATVTVSCARAGDCSAGGFYTDASQRLQGFVVSETNGVWGKAEEVPGLAALNQGGFAQVNSVSCARAGDCSAGGDYSGASGFRQGFVVGETNGVWGKAEEVPGLAALNKDGEAATVTVSCARAGDCSAGGDYRDAAGFVQGFVVGETRGVWGKAEEVPGLAALNKDEEAATVTVSCARAGDCSAVGDYSTSPGLLQGFVVSETKGVWGKAEKVPGLAALNQGEFAEVFTVSCARAGDCSAGGLYTDGSQRLQGFVLGETKGVWGKAEKVPGLAALNRGGFAAIVSVSCARAGDCSAGGFYRGASGFRQGVVVGETKGVWGKAEKVPGLAALNRGGFAYVNSVSCARVGDCSAAGLYTDGSQRLQGFVLGETKGIWGRAEEVPGLAALNRGGSVMAISVSCAQAGDCGAGGLYTDASGLRQGFVVSENSRTPPVHTR
jgi:hypothetical protein